MYLDELEVGVTGSMIVMVCWIWDVNAIIGWYLSIDFVISDAKENIMHATGRSNVAHNFLKLKACEIYSVKNFSIQPNKDEFCFFKDAPFIVKFDGETSVRKAFVKSDGFIRYPFELVELENLKVTNNKHMIAAGTCSEGDYVGRHWEKLIEKRTRHVGLYPIVLTSFGVETSKVSLLVDFSKAKAGTLENLLMWGRNRKNDAATFNCEVRIDKVRTKKGWNYPAYGGDKCKKPAT
nr:hypothetical protein [Tanacetum cinerariifolium]